MLEALEGSARWIPSEAEFINAYRAICPEVPTPQPFHIAFALFRFAVIFVGIADRARAGNAADPEAARYAPLAGRLADRAWQALGETSPLLKPTDTRHP